jgi:two-component system chemotaxis response regulator CheB
MLRVLVVDDSPTVRNLVASVLERDPEVRVVGTAASGEEAVDKTLELGPDLVTMDMRMPGMGGVGAIRQIMRERPTPIVVLCSRAADGEHDVGFDGLKAGAVEVVEKPALGEVALDRFGRELVATIKLMAEVKVVRQLGGSSGEFAVVSPPAEVVERPRSAIDAVGICSSTGGPAALEYVLRRLPASFPAPIAVVQHITEGFLVGLVEWLDRASPFRVRIAREGETARPGHVYFAPESLHLAFGPDNALTFNDAPPVRSHKPSGEVLFESVAVHHGARGMGVMLTGMGEDGADGLALLARRGGVVLVQDEESSIVYGMPRAVVERGAASEVLALDEIAERMAHWSVAGRRDGDQ